jgi:hypothetical protein
MTIRLPRLDARQAPSLHSAQDLEHTSSLKRTPRTRAWVSCLAFPPSRCAVPPSSPWSAPDPPCPVLRRLPGRGARAGSSAGRRHGQRVRRLVWCAGVEMTDAERACGLPQACRRVLREGVRARNGQRGRGQVDGRVTSLEGRRKVRRAHEVQRGARRRPPGVGGPGVAQRPRRPAWQGAEVQGKHCRMTTNTLAYTRPSCGGHTSAHREGQGGTRGLRPKRRGACSPASRTTGTLSCASLYTCVLPPCCQGVWHSTDASTAWSAGCAAPEVLGVSHRDTHRLSPDHEAALALLGATIQQHRQHQGLSQRTLATHTGLSHTY